MKKVRILLAWFMLFIYMCSSVVYADSWPSGPSVASGSAILMDATNHTILYEYNAKEKKYPASITKIVTTLVALENAGLNDTVTVEANDINSLESGSTNVNRVAGEKMKLEDALYAVMLASANEVSNAVAHSVAGSIDEFTKLMTSRAKELGCVNSNFTNPHGLYNANHYTCCYDMALISAKALELDSFRKITGSVSYTLPKTNKSDTYKMYNHQQMLTGIKKPEYKYDGCIGGKTGYTSKSGNTLVTFVEKDGLTLISVVMDSSYINQYEDSVKIMDFGYKNFQSYSIKEQEGSKLKEALAEYDKYFEVGKDDSAYIHIPEDSTIVLPKGVKYTDAKKEVKFFEDVKITNGDNVIGSIKYTYKDKVVADEDIIMSYYASSSLPSVVLPDNADEYSILLSSSSTNSTAKMSGNILDTVLVAICIVIIITVFLFVKQAIRKRRRKYAYDSRRRHSRAFWDDFDMM